MATAEGTSDAPKKSIAQRLCDLNVMIVKLFLYHQKIEGKKRSPWWTFQVLLSMMLNKIIVFESNVPFSPQYLSFDSKADINTRL